MKMRVTILFIAVCLFINVNAQSWWSKKTNYGGTARYAATGFSIGTMGYIGTGIDQSGVKQDFWEWNQITNTWTQKSNLPGSSRSDAVGWSIGNKGYIVGGGANVGGPFYPELWEYDPSLNIWVQKANFPGTTLFRATGFVIGNKGYIGTGWNGSFKNEFWEWNQITNTWTQKTSFGGSARWDAIGFSIGNKGYIGCGYATSLAVNDFWEWDQATDAWTQKANVGGLPRSGGVAFSIGGYGYVGTGGQDPGPVFTKDFWRWDPSTNTWTAEMPFSGLERGDAVSFAIGNRGYLGVGYNTGGIYYNDFWEFFPAANSLISLTTNKTDVLCNGGNNGSAVVNVSGGSMPYTYLWSNGATTGSISNLSAGIYSVVVTDNVGATVTASVTITEPSPLVINTTINHASCNLSNGSISATVSGGTPPYDWGNGSTSNSIMMAGLLPGTYSISVSDVNGCSKTVTSSVNTIGISINIAATGITCKGDNNGTIKVFPKCGLLPYIYAWSNGATTSAITNLAAGVYSVTVTDNSGATAAASTAIIEPPAFTVSTTVSNASCNANDGSISAHVSGGVGLNYMYLWNDGGQTTQSISGLSAGTYMLTVTDTMNGCKKVNILTVLEEDTIVPTAICKNVIVYLDSSGSASITAADVDGGSFDNCGIVNMQVSQNKFDCDGSKNILFSVEDASGNKSTCTTLVLVKDSISPVLTCPSDIHVNACNPQVFWNNVIVKDNCSTTLTSTHNSGDYFPLGKTNVTYTAVDSFGNSSSCSFNVFVHTDSLLTSISSSNVSCNGVSDGTVSVNVTGGCSPYSYLWSNGITSSSVSGLSAGIYSVTITDNAGLVVSAMATITQPAILVVDAVVNNGNCNANNGTISLNANGGVPPYNYNWSNGATTQNISGLSADTYNVIITDANGCSANLSKIIISSSPITVDAGANQTVYYGYVPNSCVHLNGTGSGGILPYSYEWSTGDTTKSIKVCPTSNKQYTLTVTDAQGCFATDVVKVCVLNIRCNKVCNNSDKVEICHTMGNGKTQTLCVAASAVPAHLAHGDKLGACGTQTSCEEGYAKEASYPDIIHDEMGITAYPNPFLSEVTVRFNVTYQEQVEVAIYNILGIKVAILFDGIIEGMELYETKFVADESLPNGIYFLKIITSKGDMKVVRVLLSK